MTDDAKNDSDFDWDEAAQAAQTVRASEKQVAFCRAVLAGASNTAAARQAGYAGADVQLRSAGYAAARSGKVQALLSLARAGGAGVMDDILSADEARRILSRLARQGDPQAKVRAITALERMDSRSVALADAYSGDPADTVREMLKLAGPMGVLALIGNFMKTHKSLFGFPLAREILPLMRREFPEAMARCMTPAIIEDLASGPVLSVEQIIGKETTANGHSVTNGAATQASAEQHEQGAGLTFNNERQEWEPGIDLDIDRARKRSESNG